MNGVTISRLGLSVSRLVVRSQMAIGNINYILIRI
jgi:hypothetical protein